MGVVSSSNILYLNVSSGFLVNKKKEISVRGYEGILLKIERKTDDFEGNPVEKIVLVMKDTKSDEIAHITFTEESWYCATIFPRLDLCDPTKPMTIGVSGSDKENSKASFAWLKQGSETIKIEKGSFPVPEKVKVGKKEVPSWEKVLENAAKIMDRINGSLGEVDSAGDDHIPDTTDVGF